MGMEILTEQKTGHTRMMKREEVKLICKGILILLIVMLNGDWWMNLMI